MYFQLFVSFLFCFFQCTFVSPPTLRKFQFAVYCLFIAMSFLKNCKKKRNVKYDMYVIYGELLQVTGFPCSVAVWLTGIWFVPP